MAEFERGRRPRGPRNGRGAPDSREPHFRLRLSQFCRLECRDDLVLADTWKRECCPDWRRRGQDIVGCNQIGVPVTIAVRVVVAGIGRVVPDAFEANDDTPPNPRPSLGPDRDDAYTQLMRSIGDGRSGESDICVLRRNAHLDFASRSLAVRCTRICRDPVRCGEYDSKRNRDAKIRGSCGVGSAQFGTVRPAEEAADESPGLAK